MVVVNADADVDAPGSDMPTPSASPPPAPSMSAADKMDTLWSGEAPSTAWTDSAAVTPPPTECAAGADGRGCEDNDNDNNDNNNNNSGRAAVPWPHNTYQVFLKGSDRALYTVNNTVALKPLTSSTTSSAAADASTHWLVVEENGYFGLHNPHAGTYLGHDGHQGIRAAARALDAWEMLTPRLHPDGGYQLLFPFYWHTLMVLCVGEDGAGVVRRHHGTTLWEFVAL